MAKLYTDEVIEMVEAAEWKCLMEEKGAGKDFAWAFNHGVKVMTSMILHRFAVHDLKEDQQNDQPGKN